MSQQRNRIRYYTGQFLREEDFTDQQSYHVDARWEHNRLLHTVGVVQGLELSFDPGGSAVRVAGGVAIDPQGREILLGEGRVLDTKGETGPATLLVTIAFGEEESRPSPDAPMGVSGDINTRYLPAPELALVAKLSEPDHIVLGRVTIDGKGTVTGTDRGAGGDARRVAGARGGEMSAVSLGIGTASPKAALDIGAIVSQPGTASNPQGDDLGITKAILTRGHSDPNFKLKAVSGKGDASGSAQATFGLHYSPDSDPIAVPGGDVATFRFHRGDQALDGALAIVTQNAERLRVDKDGKVGIGTASPAAALDIGIKGGLHLPAAGPGSPDNEVMFGNNGQIRSGDDNHRIIFDRDANRFEIREYGDIVLSTNVTKGTRTDSLFIDRSGRIGVGTASPAAALDIGGTALNTVQAILARGNEDTRFQLQATNGTGTKSGDAQATFGLALAGIGEVATLRFNRGDQAQDGSLAIRTNDAERLRVDKDGNVGIGVVEPKATLHVSGSIASGPIALLNEAGRISASGKSAEVTFLRRDLATYPDQPKPGDRYCWYTDAVDGTGVATLWTEGKGDLLRITADGKVGIGTGTRLPAAPLDLGADASISTRAVFGRSPSAADHQFFARIQEVNNKDTTGAEFSSQLGIQQAGIRVSDGSYTTNDKSYIKFMSQTQDPDYGELAIFLGRSERVRVNRDGHVGIGNTTPFAALDIGIKGGLRLPKADVESSDNEIFFIDNGQIRSGDNNHRIVFDRVDNKLEIREFGDIILSANAKDGKRTSTMVVSASGRVGINTPSPAAALDILTAKRDGTHEHGLALYVTTDSKADGKGVEFRHNNGTQGIGFGYNTMYATGSNANQQLSIKTSSNKITLNAKLEGIDENSPPFKEGETIDNNSARATVKIDGDLYVTGRVGIAAGQSSNVPNPIPKTKGWYGGLRVFDIEIEGSAFSRKVVSNERADLAEMYLSDSRLEAGEIVSLDPENNRVILAQRPYDDGVIGIVSTAPGFLLNSDPRAEDLPDGPSEHPIALAGRVPCKVTDENGPIRRGDRLTASSKPGYAMRSEPVVVGGVPIHRPGTLVGKALEAHASGEGTIEVFVTLQ